MYDKIKLGLTRNRLFEFCNCVCFVGTIKESVDERIKTLADFDTNNFII